MRVSTTVFAGIAVVAGIVSGQLWRELRAERLENESLRTQLADSKIPHQSTLPATTAVPQVAASATTPAAQGATPESAQDRAAELQSRTAAASATLSALTSSLGIGTNQDLMKDPEYRKARLAQMRIEIAKTYPGLAEELGLSEKEANQFFDLLAENQLKMTSEITGRTNGGPPTDIAELMRRSQATQKEQDDAIRTMMGAGRYDQYQAYMKTRPARQQVVTMGTQLAAAGAPLSDAQSRSLTTVMIAEQQRQRTAAPTQPANTGQPRDIQSMLAETQNRQDEANRRVLDAVGPQLNPRQLAALKEQYDKQSAARRDTASRLQEIEQRLGRPAAGAAPQRP